MISSPARQVVRGSLLLMGLGLGACAPKFHPLETGVYEPRASDSSEQLRLRYDGSFTYEHAGWGITEGTWARDGRELVLTAPTYVRVEAFGQVSASTATVPLQVLRPTGELQRDVVLVFLRDQVEESRERVDDEGVARVSRYLPYDAVRVLPADVDTPRGHLVTHPAFHEPAAAYRITLPMGRRFDDERWMIRKERLVRPQGAERPRRAYRWREPPREILPARDTEGP